MGLSPRVRGNPGSIGTRCLAWGPIPACAGQPSGGCVGPSKSGAYPRVCGATADRYYATALHEGLSPRVRGNLYVARANVVRFGPIPACAGQPSASLIRTSLSRAYPRVCGATDEGQRLLHDLQGLSPRVRGNPGGRGLFPPTRRPIPACAGQPPTATMRRPCMRAYPRVCGATLGQLGLDAWLGGLSPRVRGNLLAAVWGRLSLGPIPACAGQPSAPCRGSAAWGAYPRVCGATCVKSKSANFRRGLSPRVRGNQGH